MLKVMAFLNKRADLETAAFIDYYYGGERVATDEQRFLDRPRTRAYIVEEHVTSTPEVEQPSP